MKRAIPIESGVAISSAMTAAQRVPKTSGQTHDQKLVAPFGSWPALANRAGMLWMMRKSATAARVARIRDPATTVLVEKTRSPRRTFALGLMAPAVPAVIACFLSSGSPGRAAEVGAPLGPGCEAAQAERVEHYLMLAVAFETLSARSLDSGAE